MERNSVQLRMRRFTHGIGRWLVLAAFIGIGHAPAFAGQVDMAARDEAMQPMSMLDCPPCATCYLGPAPTAGKTGSSDRPDGIAAASWITQQDRSTGSQGAISAIAIRPTIALRILHCRWLN